MGNSGKWGLTPLFEKTDKGGGKHCTDSMSARLCCERPTGWRVGKEVDRAMTRHRVARSLLLAVALSLWSQRVDAQGPTIDTGAPAGPGSNASTLGSSPGANDSTLGSSPGTGGGAAGGQQGAVLGGRAGPSVPRIPSAIAQQPFGIPAQGGIAAPQPTPNPEVQLYGAPLSEPLRPEYEGPP